MQSSVSSATLAQLSKSPLGAMGAHMGDATFGAGVFAFDAHLGNVAGSAPFLVAPTASDMQSWTEEIDYSEKYYDDIYEYRRVTVPRSLFQFFPQGRCMTEAEWRCEGNMMSRGWQHYDQHSPEANVLLFRRVIGTCSKTGRIPPEMAAKVQEREQYIAELEKARQRMLSDRSACREALGG